MQTAAPVISLEPLLVKPAEAAAMLSIGKRTHWALTARGDISCVYIGKAKRYSVAALKAWVDKQQR